jgi:peptidoglycan hydrolase CwlO-like protein
MFMKLPLLCHFQEEEVQKYDEQLEDLEEQVQARKDKCEEAKRLLDSSESTFKEIDQRIRAVADMADPLKVLTCSDV